MKSLESLLGTFLELHPEDAAHAFETLEFTEAQRLFENLPPSVAASLLERLNPTLALRLLKHLDTRQAAELLTETSPRKASSLFEQLDQSHRGQVLEMLPSATAKVLREMAEYPPESAGAIMEPHVASLPIDLSVERAISTIRKTPREALHYLYVTDRKGRLVGVINMRDLLLAEPEDPIEKLVKREMVTLPVSTDREEVVNLMRERGFLALPVVDSDGHLLGVVKHDEVLLAGQEEAFEDLQTLVGAGKDELALSPISFVIRNRLPWLYVNLATAFLAAAVVGMFEGIIAKIAALAVLLPVVAGQGGNTGAQSLAVVIRGLALREIVPGVRRRLIRKELLSGLINGVAVAIITAAAVFAWRMTTGDSLRFSSGLALVIGLAMVVNMVIAGMAGAMIPLVLQGLGRDPAQSASIFLTTVTDVIGFASFLGFAVAFSALLL